MKYGVIILFIFTEEEVILSYEIVVQKECKYFRVTSVLVKMIASGGVIGICNTSFNFKEILKKLRFSVKRRK